MKSPPKLLRINNQLNEYECKQQNNEMKTKNIINLKNNNTNSNGKINNKNNYKPTLLKKLTNDTDSTKCVNLIQSGQFNNLHLYINNNDSDNSKSIKNIRSQLNPSPNNINQINSPQSPNKIQQNQLQIQDSLQLITPTHQSNYLKECLLSSIGQFKQLQKNINNRINNLRIDQEVNNLKDWKKYKVYKNGPLKIGLNSWNKSLRK